MGLAQLKLNYSRLGPLCSDSLMLYSLRLDPVDAFLLNAGIKEEVFNLKCVVINK